MNHKIIKFQIFGDSRGSLVSFEEKKNIPFCIKRVYCVYGTNPDQERGKHAHKELEQVVVCVSGSCTIILDDGEKREAIKMNKPNAGLYIGKNTWREMSNFSNDCVLIVLANEYYDEKEYIRNYEEFLNGTAL